MAKKPVAQRRERVLDTALALVVEEGLKGTTISQISKRAKLSPGIIYYYFDSKDEIFHHIFADTEQIFVDTISHGDPLALPLFDCYQQMWLNMFRFGIENPQRLLYVESYRNSIYFKDRTSNIREKFLERVQEKTREGVQRGEFKDLPIEAIFAMVFRPAIELSKLQVAGFDFLSGTSIEEIAVSVCGSLFK